MDNGNLTPGGCKFFYHYRNGLHLDVYDDYIEIITGAPRSGGAQGYGGQSVYVSFQDIESVSVQQGYLVFNYAPHIDPNIIRSFMFEPKYFQYAQNTVNFIMARIEDIRASVMEDELPEIPWSPVQGRAREFYLQGHTFYVSPELDAFNSYRLLYRDAAINYTDRLAADYQARVRDLDSFLLFYRTMYKKYLDKLIQRSLDILVSAGIWTEVYDSFLERHVVNFNLALEDYNTVVENLNLTVLANKQQVASRAAWLPTVVGGGFGLQGAITGIAAATAFNLARDGIETSMINNTRIKPQQKAELYARLNPGTLLFRAYLDYWRVFLTLVIILRENGRAVWFPDEQQFGRVSNVFRNLSNPNFPQDQLLDVALEVLRVNPYNKDHHLFLLNRIGPEAKDIADYFGYTDFRDPRLC